MSLASEETLRLLLAAFTGGVPLAGAGLASNETLAALVTAVQPSVVVVPPLGGGADDSAHIASIFAGGASWVLLQSGKTYTFATPLKPPSNTRLSGYGAIVNSTIVNLGQPSNCPIYIDVPPGAGLFAGSLASTPAVGATSISVTAGAPIVAGQTIALAHGVGYEVAIAGVVTGSGPYTVPLLNDQGLPYALCQPFQSGDTVEVYAAGSLPHDITIQGIKFTGSGAQMIECARARRVGIFDCILAPSANVTGWGLDEGCVDCVVENVRCYLQGSGTGKVGGYCQSNRGTRVVNCTSEGNDYGINLIDCYGCVVEGGRVQSVGGYGVMVTSLPFDPTHPSFGCTDCVVRDVQVFEVPTGVLVYGSSNLLLEGVSCESCSTNGIAITTSATTPTADGTDIIGCKAKGCGVALLANTSVTNTRAKDFCGDGATVAVISAPGDFDGSGIRATVTALVSAGITLTCANARLRDVNLTVPAGSVGIQSNATNAWVSDSVVTSPSSVCYYLVAGTLRISTCKAVGSTSSTGLYITSGCFARVGAHCDFDGAATPLTIASGGFCSRGASVVANGTTTVNVSWPDLKPTERVALTRSADGGTPGPTPRVTITAGTGFAINGTAADTSTYAYVIS